MNSINNTYSSVPVPTLTELAIGMLASIPANFVVTRIHENGHAFIINRLYDNANTIINYDPFSLVSLLGLMGARTLYRDSDPNALGKWLGPSHTKALIAAAGPTAEIISTLAIRLLTGSDRRAALVMLVPAVNLGLYALHGLGAVGNQDDVYTALRYMGHDYYEVLVNGGKVAYGLLTACALASTASIMRDSLGDLFDLNLDTNSTGDAPRLGSVNQDEPRSAIPTTNLEVNEE